MFGYILQTPYVLAAMLLISFNLSLAMTSRSGTASFFKSAKKCFSLLLALLLVAHSASAGPLLCGIDRLEASGFRELSGLRVGLITNAASRSMKGEADYALMLRHGVRLKFLMAPEHGFSIDIEAGKKVGRTALADSLPIFSLYGASKKPATAQLHEIDLLVFDLQDIGTRCYTYISTMKSAMEACEEAGVPFMVLDRPNPVAPLKPEGFIVAAGYDSFVSAVNIPFVHSMTVGEIALLLKREHYKKLDLRVIAMSGYRRDRFGDEYSGFHFISPSPNIKSVTAATLYPATVFLEATRVSEGRGSEAPFEQFGAPFINPQKLLLALRAYALPGVVFDPVSFTPLSGKFRGERCQGLKLTVTSRQLFRPFRTAAAILLALQQLYSEQLGLQEGGEFFDKLAGTPRFREMILRQMELETIMEESARQIAAFNQERALDRLYP